MTVKLLNELGDQDHYIVTERIPASSADFFNNQITIPFTTIDTPPTGVKYVDANNNLKLRIYLTEMYLPYPREISPPFSARTLGIIGDWAYNRERRVFTRIYVSYCACSNSSFWVGVFIYSSEKTLVPPKTKQKRGWAFIQDGLIFARVQC